MKTKILFLAIFGVYLSNIISAQDFSIGIKNGISNTGITGNFDNKKLSGGPTYIGYHFMVNGPNGNINYSKYFTNSSGFLKPSIGCVVNYKINNHASILAEFLYEEKGFDFVYMEWGTSMHGFYKTQYLSFPVSFSYEVGKHIKYYCYNGLSLKFLIKANNYTSGTYETGVPFEYITIDESYKPTEFNKKELSALTGLGIKIPITDKAKFIIDFRYDFGVTRAAQNTDYSVYSAQNTNPSDLPSNFQNVFNRSVSLNCGILCNINKRQKTQCK